MSYNEKDIKDLLRIIPQKGKVEWIGIRSKKKEELSVVESVKVEKETGLESDHFKGSFSSNQHYSRCSSNKRQLFHSQNLFN